VEDLARPDVKELVASAERVGVRVEARSKDALDGLANGVKHQGVLAIAGEYRYVELESILEAPSPALLVALDEITDPHNFGAIVRSAVGFGADGLLVPKHRSAPVTAVVVRASAGATEHARIAQVTNLQRTLLELGKRGFDVIGLAGDGTVDIGDLPRSEVGRVLVVGSEGSGLRRMVRERCTTIARIPQPGPVESLNASVAAGIALYECARSRR
jgi:23S rRNA (guanosine2251-2'-O)-methyltransferase